MGGGATTQLTIVGDVSEQVKDDYSGPKVSGDETTRMYICAKRGAAGEEMFRESI